MSIAINAKQCVGCGKCSMVCPGSLIHMNADGKAFIKYPKDCWGLHLLSEGVCSTRLAFIWEQIWAGHGQSGTHGKRGRCPTLDHRSPRRKNQ